MKRIRLVLALLVAALWSDIFDRETWRKARAAGRALVGGIDVGDKVEPDIFRGRMNACEACPFFFAPLRTCGTPLKRDLRDYGCWCQLDYKNEQRESGCWGDEECGEGFPSGWRAHGAS